MARIVLGIFGVCGFFLMLGGGLLAIAESSRDTTVAEYDAQMKEVRIHNNGLIADRQAGVTWKSAAAIVGAILFAAAWLVETSNGIAAAVAEQAEAVEAQNRLMEAMLENAKPAAETPARRPPLPLPARKPQ
jgi:hypothetical protein